MSAVVRRVGIDLGTTHTVMAWVDDKHPETDAPTVRVEPIAQLIGSGTVHSLNQLPSFIYQAHAQEISESACALPWDAKPDYLTGAWARDLGAKTPLRLVHSAKSWLSHGQVDRKAPLLPFDGLPEHGEAHTDEASIVKISPYEATRAYLQHLKMAWNNAHPAQPLQSQSIVLTVPASFDPAARELTAEAAQSLGLNISLLEEPQAAFYAWISEQGDAWRDQLKAGDTVLVVDVGGGTTDLSLIQVQGSEQGELVLERVAVGDHILLGGDNMDLALAYALSRQLAEQGKKLKTWQILGLTQGCRTAKEQLFADPSLESVTVLVPSRGSKLIGGSLTVALTRACLEQVLLEGFFPMCSLNDAPLEQTDAALAQLGLPYAKDAGITRHLAGFLRQQADALGEADFARPTAVLLNGGVFKAEALSERLLACVNQWLSSAGHSLTRLLEGADLDLAVAKGAAYFGQVKQGKGIRIRGGVARSYYIGVASSMPAVPGMPAPLQALCVAPFGMEAGTSVTIDAHAFALSVGAPVRFEFFSSTVRREDQVGELIEDWDEDELVQLPDVRVTLAANQSQGASVRVTMGVTLTEIGTLQLHAYPPTGEPWQIELDVRETAD